MNTSHTNEQPEEGALSVFIKAAATNPEVSPEKLREFLAARREWEADEARKAYNAAVAEFQRTAPIVPKSTKGQKGDYAALDQIWSAVRRRLTDLGLAVTWNIVELKGEGEGQFCHLDGMLRHKLGHGERLAFDLPLPGIIKTSDGRAVINPSQMMGSAVSYAKRYALCAALGIVTGEDDDADSLSPNGLCVDDAQAREIEDLLAAARGVDGFNEKAFWAWLGCDKVREIYARQHAGAVQALKAKIAGKGAR